MVQVYSPLLWKGLVCLDPQRVYDLVPFFLLPSMIKMASSTHPNSMNVTINPDIAKSPGVGMEATKPPLVENHCSRWS